MKGFIGIPIALLATILIALGSLSALLVNISGLLQEPEITSGAQEPQEETFGGLQGQANAASTSSFTISSTAIRLTATSSCAARIISVPQSAAGVRVTLSDAFGERPTATAGILLHASSSPYVFASEDIGCGAIYGIAAQGASATLEITDSF